MDFRIRYPYHAVRHIDVYFRAIFRPIRNCEKYRKPDYPCPPVHDWWKWDGRRA